MVRRVKEVNIGLCKILLLSKLCLKHNFSQKMDGDVGPAKVKVGWPSSLRPAHPVFQPALHFRSNTAVDQLKEVEMLRPLRLFLGLSGINQQSQSNLYTSGLPGRIREILGGSLLL